LLQAVTIPVIASGGVKNLDHIRELLPLAEEGLEGVITGRAVYEGTLDLAQAIALTKP
jgi:phosphoribosylformimino-5-aminoimidazole carboxamide ribotide isomerase